MGEIYLGIIIFYHIHTAKQQSYKEHVYKKLLPTCTIACAINCMHGRLQVVVGYIPLLQTYTTPLIKKKVTQLELGSIAKLFGRYAVQWTTLAHRSRLGIQHTCNHAPCKFRSSFNTSRQLTSDKWISTKISLRRELFPL